MIYKLFLKIMNVPVSILAFLIFISLPLQEDHYKESREKMVKQQIENRGIKDKSVLKAMRSVKRHLFVPENIISEAYSDRPLPIGYGQTISQPYIVAYMTEVIKPNEQFKVLEIGTGSGYQASVLAEIVKEGGKMVIPIGSPFMTQMLMLVEKKKGKAITKSLMLVAFVSFVRKN